MAGVLDEKDMDLYSTSVIDKMRTLSETKRAYLIENGMAALGTS